MFKPGSSQRDYTLCSQFDDALDLPDIPALGDDATPEDIEKRDTIAAERAQKLKVARERAEWPVKAGRKATIFTFRHIPGSDVDWWVGQNDKMGPIEGRALLFRLALKQIENLGSITVKLEDAEGRRFCSAATLDELYNIADGLGRKVVGELATIVAGKTFGGVDPL